MKTLELTKRARILKEYESNQATIQKIVGLTELEYKARIYQTGLAFLEMLYPEKEKIYEDIKGTIECAS